MSQTRARGAITNRRRRRFLCAAVLVFASPIAGGALADNRFERIDQETASARLELRGSDGRAFRPKAFIIAGAREAFSAPAPPQLDAEPASGLPAARLPLIGDWFRSRSAPPPDLRGAPVHASGDAMALDLRSWPDGAFVAGMEAARGGRLYLVTRPRMTVLVLRPGLSRSMFRAAPAPDFSGEQVGEAFLDGDALVIAPLARDFYGARPW